MTNFDWFLPFYFSEMEIWNHGVPAFSFSQKTKIKLIYFIKKSSIFGWNEKVFRNLKKSQDRLVVLFQNGFKPKSVFYEKIAKFSKYFIFWFCGWLASNFDLASHWDFISNPKISGISGLRKPWKMAVPAADPLKNPGNTDFHQNLSISESRISIISDLTTGPKLRIHIFCEQKMGTQIQSDLGSRTGFRFWGTPKWGSGGQNPRFWSLEIFKFRGITLRNSLTNFEIS